jgi:hypothetical protein
VPSISSGERWENESTRKIRVAVLFEASTTSSPLIEAEVSGSLSFKPPIRRALYLLLFLDFVFPFTSSFLVTSATVFVIGKVMSVFQGTELV